MRQIKNLVKDEERVWIFLEDDEASKDFLQRAKEEGFTFVSGDPIIGDEGGYLYGVHSDFTIAHLAAFIWCLSFQIDAPGTKTRIDYVKFMRGDDDYICKEPHMSGYMTNKANSL